MYVASVGYRPPASVSTGWSLPFCRRMREKFCGFLLEMPLIDCIITMSFTSRDEIKFGILNPGKLMF